jgi:hypothetical protein
VKAGELGVERPLDPPSEAWVACKQRTESAEILLHVAPELDSLE